MIKNEKINKTCAYCNSHAWHDEKAHHICLLAGGEGGEMSCEGSCDRWQESRRGFVGCRQHSDCFYDTDEIEGNVKDDKYTRRKK